MPSLGWQAEGSGAPRASVSLRCYPYAMTELGQQLPKFLQYRQFGAKKGLIRIVYTEPAASGTPKASPEILVQRCPVRGRHLLSA